MVSLGKFTDKYGNTWPSEHEMRVANLNYEMMKLLTEDADLVTADAHRLMMMIQENQVFRAKFIQYCSVAEVMEIIGK